MTTPEVTKKLDKALADLLVSDAPLAQRLAEYATSVKVLNAPFADAVERLVVRLASVGAGSAAPQLGDVFPPFVLPDSTGKLVALDHLLADGPLVVAFRRGHWCPYCLISTEALARVQDAAANRGAGLVVITPEREALTSQLKARTGLACPVLSDMDNGYAMSIGLAISVGEELRGYMTARGRDLASYQGNDAWILPIPATFVLDGEGKVIMRHVDADYRTRAETDDILSAIEQARR